MLSAALGLAVAHAEPCALGGAADDAFEVRIGAEGVRVVLELWLAGAEEGWAESVLDALDARGLHGVVVAPPGEPAPVVRAVLERVAKGPHEVAVVLPSDLLPRSMEDPVRPVRKAIAPIRGVSGRVRAAIAPIGSKVVEAKLGSAGLRSLADAEGPPTGEPRMAGVFEGQPRVNVVLPAGPYEDACGTDPRVGPFLPAAADRAALAIQRATRFGGTPIARVALLGSRGAATDAEVLGRWLDTVVLPGGVVVGTAEEARQAALQGWRRPAAERPPPVDAGGGRLVAIAEVRTAAEALAEGVVVPRTLPGDLSPTEAFLGLLLVVAEHTEGDVVRLRALRGPAQLASTTLDGETTLSSDAVRAAARQLLAALPSEVPAALSVDGQLLTASELLLALASVVRGEDPAVVRPIDVPEPNQRGLGWGTSTTP